MSQAMTKKAETGNFTTLRSMLDKQKEEIAKALPAQMDVEKMIRVALTAVHKTPALLKCDPLSIVGCVMQAAELGLELSGVLGQCYMVPRYNKHIGMDAASFQVGYRGFQTLAYRSGKVQAFPLRVVYERDKFTVAYGTSHYIIHEPFLDGDPGKVRAFYAVLKFTGGGEADFEVMSIQQMEAHRDKYRSTKGVGPWDTNFEEMGKKTVCRRLAKRAPVSTDLVQAAVLDEYGEAGLDQRLTDGGTTAEATKARLEMLKDRINEQSEAGSGEEGEGPPPVLADQSQLDCIQSLFQSLKWDEVRISAFLEEYAPTSQMTVQQAGAATAELQGILDKSTK